MKVFLVFALFLAVASADPIQHSLVTETTTIVRELQLEPRYHLSWTVDFITNIITFTARVETLGYVGLGISGQGNMIGADIFVAGAFDNGNEYHGDYHGPDAYLLKDDIPNWSLVSAREADGFTTIIVSRNLSNCDDPKQDVAITQDTQYIIWAIGVDDTIKKHEDTNRGSSIVNFLDPAPAETDFTKFLSFNITRANYEVPAVDTTYWCTIHQVPSTFNGASTHIVAFDMILPNEADLRHVHHAVLHRCNPPEGETSEFFLNYTRDDMGDFCYTETPSIPTNYCMPFFMWSVGGGPLVLPDDVGYTMGTTGEFEYVMLEIHYDNPEETSGNVTNAGVQVYYIETKRDIEGGVMLLGHTTGHQQVIPPETKDFVSVAHCGSACTKDTLPAGGSHIFNVLLHSHLTGRKMKVRHFRETEELPWIANDEHYDFNYQAARPLRNHIQFLPGDHLVAECTYDNNEARVILGGHPSTKEMCHTFLWIYPYNNFIFCESHLEPMTPLLDMFGIEALDWNGLMSQDPMVSLPAELNNQTFSQVLSSANWTETLRKDVQALRYAPQAQTCLGGPGDVGPVINYPYVTKVYEPVDTCASQPDPTDPDPDPTDPDPTDPDPDPTDPDPDPTDPDPDPTDPNTTPCPDTGDEPDVNISFNMYNNITINIADNSTERSGAERLTNYEVTGLLVLCSITHLLLKS